MLCLNTCTKRMAVAASCTSEAKLMPITYTHCLVSSRYVSRGCSIRQLWDFGERDRSGLKSSSPCRGECRASAPAITHMEDVTFTLLIRSFEALIPNKKVPVEVPSTPLQIDVCVSHMSSARLTIHHVSDCHVCYWARWRCLVSHKRNDCRWIKKRYTLADLGRLAVR